MILSALIQKIIEVAGHSRVYPIARRRDDDQLSPFIVVGVDSSSTERHYGDGTGYQSAITDYDFEVQCFGVVQQEALEEGTKIRLALDNINGPMSDKASPETVYNVHRIEVTSELMDHDFNHDLFYYSLFITVTT